MSSAKGGLLAEMAEIRSSSSSQLNSTASKLPPRSSTSPALESHRDKADIELTPHDWDTYIEQEDPSLVKAKKPNWLRRKFSIRVSLLILIAVQLLVVAFVLSWLWYQEASDSVSDVSKDLVKQCAHYTAALSNEWLHSAQALLDHLKEPFEHGTIDLTTIEDHIIEVLSTNSRYNELFFAVGSTAFYGALRSSDGNFFAMTVVEGGCYGLYEVGNELQIGDVVGVDCNLDLQSLSNSTDFTGGRFLLWEGIRPEALIPRGVGAEKSHLTYFDTTRYQGKDVVVGVSISSSQMRSHLCGDTNGDACKYRNAFLLGCDGAVYGSSSPDIGLASYLYDAEDATISSAGKKLALEGLEPSTPSCPRSGIVSTENEFVYVLSLPESSMPYCVACVIPENVLMDGMKDNTQTAVLITLGILALFLVIGWTFSWRITRPLRFLRRHLDAVLKGWDTDKPISVFQASVQDGGDEAGTVEFREVQKVVESQRKAFGVIRTIRERNALLSSMNSELKKSVMSYEARLSGAIPSRTLTIFCGTWNMGNKPPPSSLRTWISPNHDVYCLGLQEAVYGKNSQKTIFDAIEQQIGSGYVVVAGFSIVEESLDISGHGGTRMIVLVKERHKKYVTNVRTAKKTTGIGSVMWNKGGLMTAFELYDMGFCFINSHLAAHQNKIQERNDDAYNILRGLSGDNGLDVLAMYHHVFWVGDLNYRIDAPFKDTVQHIKDNNLQPLTQADQLRNEMANNRVFYGFKEGPITFPPTYKMERTPEQVYETKKMRTPSWCDRVLVKSYPGLHVSLLAYTSDSHTCTSDHRPVGAIFSINTRLPFIPTMPEYMSQIVFTDLRFSHVVQTSTAEVMSSPRSKVKSPALARSSNIHSGKITDTVCAEFYSPILRELVRSPSWTLSDEDLADSATHRPSFDAACGDAKVVGGNLKGSVVLSPTVSERSYIRTQHIIVSVIDLSTNPREGRRLGEAVLNLGSAMGASGTSFHADLIQYGLLVGEVTGRVCVRVPEYGESDKYADDGKFRVDLPELPESPGSSTSNLRDANVVGNRMSSRV